MGYIELHRCKVFPMGSVFHSPAVGFAAVCIVSGQAASIFFHLAGRANALEVRRFFGSASSPALRICSRDFWCPAPSGASSGGSGRAGNQASPGW